MNNHVLSVSTSSHPHSESHSSSRYEYKRIRSAIVLGATGGTGRAIVEELVRQNIPVIAFARSADRLQQMAIELGNPACLSWRTGDVFQTGQVEQAARDSEVIFQCAAIPYHEMNARQLPLAESVCEAAERLGAKLVFVDGIYPYSPRSGAEPIDENYPKQPPTAKGQTKLAMEQLLLGARWTSMQVMIVRLPDYYGPSANQASYLGSTMEAIAAHKPAMFIGNVSVPREYVYLPDAAHMIVELSGREQAYGQNWHIPSAGAISGKDMIELAQQAAGKGNRKPVIPLGRRSLKVLGLFVPVMKEIVEMLYLTEQPLLLSGQKYETYIGTIPRTPYPIGVQATIQSIQRKQGIADQSKVVSD